MTTLGKDITPGVLPGGEQPLRVAIIGAGPAGFYTAEHLLNHKDLNIEIDLFDRLPTPYGLVRGGVAPDHQKIKSVTKVYDRTAKK
ncbi:MAG: FAD/NAD(P)-binding protein, partial [Anaerolineales bacterium]